MKDIVIGFSLLISVPSVLWFWQYFIYLEKTNQIDLSNFDTHKIYRRNKK